MKKKRKRDFILAALWTIISVIWILNLIYGSSPSKIIVITKYIATICSVITAGIYWFTFVTDKKSKED